MKITEKEVRHIADLSNLTLTEDEVRKHAADLEEILTYVKKLDELDTSKVEPMSQVLYEGAENSTLREDKHSKSLDRDVILRSAPQSGVGQFKVPNVIER